MAAVLFKELKDRLGELLTPSELDQRTSILWGVELSCQRTTELMEVMLASLPLEEQPSKLFKTVFLHHLPEDLKDLVAIQFHQLESMELAKFADIFWDAVRTAPLRRTPLLRRRQPWRRQ